MPRFVIQEHHARSHHFDFRLEKDGVFKSWAVPKGIPESTGLKRLAIQVDDHDLSFGDFAGQIPHGQYGAGHVEIWDSGEFQEEVWGPERIVFTLQGRRSKGRFILTKFPRGKPREWLFIRASAPGE